MRQATLGSAMTAAQGKPVGFDYLRLGLALAIFAVHCVGSTNQPKLFLADAPLLVGPIMALVPAFFALSGFLVAGSLVRNPTLIGFGTMRAARILPALVVDTLFAALVLGPAFTSLSLRDYFSSRGFWTYFLNIAGLPHFRLPGVFGGNPSDLVNSQLWTIPLELYAYAALFALALLGILRRPRILLALTFGLSGWLVWHIVAQGMGTYIGDSLVPSFLLGVCAFHWRERVVLSGWVATLSLGIIILAWPLRMLAPLLPFATVYITLAAGVTNPSSNRLLRSGDYSYGIYLYSLPIIQALIAAVPFARTWYGALLLATPTVFLFAAASWHFVERPVLARRAKIARKLTMLAGRAFPSRTDAAPQDGA